MMRNVVLGAVVGFAAVVTLLSFLSHEPAPAAPAPDAAAATAAADAGHVVTNVPMRAMTRVPHVPTALGPLGNHAVFMSPPAPAGDAGP